MITKHTQETFLEKANLVHSNYYDYSKSLFKNVASDIIIICPIHGEFKQRVSHHFGGSGCSSCNISKANTRKIDPKDFIERCNKIHDNKYDYSKTVFVGMKKKVDIICKTHGEFSQIAMFHARGVGCRKCAIEKSSISTETAISGFNRVHKNIYDYSLVNYVRNIVPVIIICKIHGEFEQTPKDHLRGRGCGACGCEGNTFYNDAIKWKNKSKNSKYFKAFSFYIFKLSNDFETFYKFGITFTSIYRRHNNSNMPYSMELVHLVEDLTDAEKIFNLELKTKSIVSSNRYIPKLYFGGHSECFDSSVNVEELISNISS